VSSIVKLLTYIRATVKMFSEDMLFAMTSAAKPTMASAVGGLCRDALATRRVDSSSAEMQPRPIPRKGDT
jgi:hypothetical protein